MQGRALWLLPLCALLLAACGALAYPASAPYEDAQATAVASTPAYEPSPLPEQPASPTPASARPSATALPPTPQPAATQTLAFFILPSPTASGGTPFPIITIAPIFLSPLPDTGGGEEPTPPIFIPVTGNETPEPVATPDVVSQVENQLKDINDQLTSGRLAYDPPEQLAVGETTILRVGLVPLLGQSEPSVDATLAVDLNTEVEDLETATIATSLVMEASLSGDPGAFAIRQLHQNPRQLIAADESTQWAWEVTALRPGTHNLTLTISVVLDVGGVSETRSKTYSNDIEVRVNPAITGGYLLGLYWLPLLVLAAIGAGLTIRQLRFRATKRSLLAALAAAPPEEGQRYIFVSYSHRDERFVIPLARDLMGRGIRIWLDQREIIAGEDWMQQLEEGLKETDALLVVLSPRSVASKYVMQEVAAAQAAKKPVFPIMYKTCDLPPNLSPIHFVDFRSDVPSALDTLVGNLTQAGYRQP